MRCRKCHETAVFNMRHHKLALCGEHFTDWFVQRTEQTIHKFRMFTMEDKILVAVSGGKDSLALWDVLLRQGYKADGMYIGLGIDGGFGYSGESREKVEAFAAQHPETRLVIADLQNEHGQTVPELAIAKRRLNKPCSICGLVKRHTMNRVALEGGYNVLATGHNLDDEVAVLMQNTLRWQTGYLDRQYPVLEEEAGFARKVKPLCRFYEREVAAYALVKGIDYIYEECPHAAGAKTIYYKEILNQLESASPGTKYAFFTEFLRAKKKGRVTFDQEAERSELHPCQICGQPTTAPNICSFCRLWENKSEPESTPVSSPA